ncbi:hypothetical protein [Diaphorobacter ruginosibacter]|uniref:hypothetical protein n=1 Tax=Diaphorobacter ruginosibacter TaxID=1715720 RepID=UPI00333FE761
MSGGTPIVPRGGNAANVFAIEEARHGPPGLLNPGKMPAPANALPHEESTTP